MSTQLIKPLITEKMTAQGDKLNRYGFVVEPCANKLEIKEAVEKMYGVKVEEINTMNYRGKTKTRFTKAGILSGRNVHRKKAIVTLAEGDKIDFYSNI
ncbi:MAG: 50S ribosomal protein L23 [Prevotellaceae bacterium]|jgi:large subunit ribosomal protein L23|nr:50S ribosomal protein L23 [Prevotellaceae bacterium]